MVLDGDALAGIVTERDYARKVILKGRSSETAAVRDIMTTGVTTTAPGESVEHCMSIVTEQRIRHLPVVEDGKLVGIISIGDLVKAVIADQQEAIEHLQHYING